MSTQPRWRSALLLAAFAWAGPTRSATAILSEEHHYEPHHHPGNQVNYNPGIFLGYSPYGPYVYSPPLVVIGPGGLPPVMPILQQQAVPMIGQGGGGLMLPMPPAELFDPNPASAPVARPRRPNANRMRELVEIGDRSFRGGNIRRAEERFLLAIKADPTSPLPHIHVAQVSIVRGDYAAAAKSFRAAIASPEGPGWLLTAPDIQRIFAEPADFARRLGKLESHLQAHPTDRDAWFVLGAEWYLSGRTQQAADAFQRIADRKPDEALSAFIDASSPRRRGPN